MPAPARGADVAPSHEYRLRLAVAGAPREWSVLHAGAVLTQADEQRLLNQPPERRTYGAALWPSAIALAHDLAARADAIRGRRLLELGAGTGLPGIVAASLGARVVQTDRLAHVLDACRRNGARNAAPDVEYRLADWAAWDDATRYDWIVGADVTYGETSQPHLRRILDANLAPGGRVLLADPFRPLSLPFLEAMAGDGWGLTLAKWTVGEASATRDVGVFELTPPAR